MFMTLKSIHAFILYIKNIAHLITDPTTHPSKRTEAIPSELFAKVRVFAQTSVWWELKNYINDGNSLRLVEMCIYI